MMTAARYNYLKQHPDEVKPDELGYFEQTKLWEKRSAAAKRAVETKRAKYTTWPTRKGDHKDV